MEQAPGSTQQLSELQAAHLLPPLRTPVVTHDVPRIPRERRQRANIVGRAGLPNPRPSLAFLPKFESHCVV
eukprot:7112734-Alexandrium_andersonii.AAC.1